MGLTRADINSDAVFSAVKDIAERAKAEGMLVNFGGGISFDAVPFIQKLYPLNDRFETRKIIFRGGMMRQNSRQAFCSPWNLKHFTWKTSAPTMIVWQERIGSV